ncbi:MAG: Mur ligase family protein, partial [Pirellulales bacterium]
NPERVAARRRQIEQISYPAALGRLSRNRETTAVAGTHGKSTTAALLSHLLRAAGRDPTYCFGATYADGSPGGRWGGGETTVIEACEFRRNFLLLTPRSAIVTNIDQDHLDCYTDEADTLAAFRQFLGKISADSVPILQLAAADKIGFTGRAETFAVEGDPQGGRADWLATEVALDAGGGRFRLRRGDTLVGEFQSPLCGRHNVENAAAAVIAALASDLTCREVARNLVTFPGVRRRLEPIRRDDGIVHFDDYAHHPTAVAATIAALRHCYRDRRIVALFQPHQATRLDRLFDDFVHALSAADAVAILEVCRAREPAGLHPEISGRLAEALQSQGVLVLPGRSWRDAWPNCLTACREGDVLVTMSAGHLEKDRYERN